MNWQSMTRGLTRVSRAKPATDRWLHTWLILVAVKPVKPEPRPLCVRCHEADSAKPAWFKQVAAKEHAGDEPCQSCHQPHSPKL